ncbi:hypothetical protein M3J09_011739 [Ascochyta lentis]
MDMALQTAGLVRRVRVLSRWWSWGLRRVYWGSFARLPDGLTPAGSAWPQAASGLAILCLPEQRAATISVSLL